MSLELGTLLEQLERQYIRLQRLFGAIMPKQEQVTARLLPKLTAVLGERERCLADVCQKLDRLEPHTMVMAEEAWARQYGVQMHCGRV